MKQQLKILSVIDIPWNSGLAAYAFDQALALKNAGHSVAFACPDGSAAMDFARRENFRAHPIPGRKEHLRLPQAVMRLRAIAREEASEIACAHTGRAQTLACALGLPLIRVKADAKKPSSGVPFHPANRIIAGSGHIARLYADTSVDMSRVTTIRQGIGLPEIQPPAAGSPLKVGLLGRLDPVKGHEIFLKAAARLLGSGRKTEFHIAGYEANIKYADLLRQAEDLEISDSVVFHGRVEGPFKFMAACDIGVIASLGSEAVSRAALEWLAAGRPLVATSVGSLPEYTAEELLVPPGDPGALADRLETLLSSPEKLPELGDSNRRRAADEFTAERFAAATVKAFDDAAAGAPSKPGWMES